MKLKLKFLMAVSFIVFYAYSQSNTSNNKNDWKIFIDKNIGYSIEYPSEWVAKGGEGGFICGKESGYKNAEWTIWLSKPNNAERIDFIFNDELTENYNFIEKPIIINGIKGIHTITTSKERTNEYSESITIKTESFWFKIENSGYKDLKFEHFYKSFKILK